MPTQTPSRTTLLDAGLAAQRAGCSLIPINGATKQPYHDLLPQVCALPRIQKNGAWLDSRGAPLDDDEIDGGKSSWAHFLHNRADAKEIMGWVKGGAQLAIVAGAISCGVECIDFDIVETTGASLHAEWREVVGALTDPLIHQRTGGGGEQYVYRYAPADGEERDGNLKLAYLPDATAKRGESVAIETRGDGGYFIIAPSRHPSGNHYALISGDWGVIPAIDANTRRALLAAARALCQSTRPADADEAARQARARSTTYSAGLNGQVSVIDAFNKAHTIIEQLERAGYVQRGRRWYHPQGGDDKRPGVVLLNDSSYHHDSDDPLADGYTHTAFDVFCHFDHNENLNDAVKAAAADLKIPFEPHGAATMRDGWACCPTHATTLRQGKKSGWYCPHPDASQPSGYCAFWWRGDGYTPPEGEPPAGDGGVAGSAPEEGKKTGGRLLTSERILEALSTLGYSFRLNVLDDTVEVNGESITDVMRAKIRTEIRDLDVKPLSAVEDVYTTAAARNPYHPIRAYLDSLVWDGTPRIVTLANHFTCTDPPIKYPDGTTRPLFTVYLGRWLVGCVAKVYVNAQNLMLVLAGPQGKGKSAFIFWLCKHLVEYHAEAPLSPGDRLCDLRVINTFIWEVSELDATTRKSDVSALKAFITRKTVTTRKYHALHDIKKPALASFAGTVNDGTGFLVDETGSRRFMVATITAIDWRYTDLDIDQIWAEAAHYYRAGMAWQLNEYEAVLQEQLNQAHEVSDPIEGWLEKFFFLGVQDDTFGMTCSDIIDHLRSHEVPVNADRSWETRIGAALRRRGCVPRQMAIGGGRRARRYFGIIIRGQ